MTAADLLALLKKHPIGSACGLLCVICAGLLYLRSSKIDESRGEYEAKSAEATAILANVRNAEMLPAQVAEILIRASQLAVNLQYFYKLEAETEVKLLDVRQGTAPKAGKSLYTPIPFNVSVQGSFKQVLAFLQKLENGPHFCRFSTVSFGKSAAGSEAARADATGTTLSLNLELLGVP
ncbi:MAG: hypothetical protein HYV75_01790 [Opitutae bacterium]|nr:hypothetical protein [Opitutae bacterium]